MQVNTIITVGGHAVPLNAPIYTAFNIVDTAHSLSQINRFTGHSARPYSVAEHSLLVSEIIAANGGGVLAQLAGLMHDAHEQVVGDVSSPLKREMRRVASGRTFEAKQLPVAKTWSDFDRVEAAAESALRVAFGLVVISRTFEREVHHADMVALATERRDLLPHHPEVWDCLTDIQPLRTVDLTATERIHATWLDWREAFIQRYWELELARRQWEAAHGVGKVEFPQRGAA